MKMVTAYSPLLLEVVFTCLESAVLVKSVCPLVFFNVFPILCSTEMESEVEVIITFPFEVTYSKKQPYLQHNLRRVSSPTTSMRSNDSSSLLLATHPMASTDNILFWTGLDPRESQLFNSRGVLYRFQVPQSTFAFSEYYANIFFLISRRSSPRTGRASRHSGEASARTEKTASQSLNGSLTADLAASLLGRSV